MKMLLRPLLFTLGGVAAGFLYYRYVGCVTGNCSITASPVNAMVYMGLMGLVLSGLFGMERKSCIT